MKDELWGEHVGFACTDCRFFEVHHADERRTIGACHRFPPVGEYSRADEIAGFRQVLSSDWCGEFELTQSARTAWEAEVIERMNRGIA